MLRSTGSRVGGVSLGLACPSSVSSGKKKASSHVNRKRWLITLGGLLSVAASIAAIVGLFITLGGNHVSPPPTPTPDPHLATYQATAPGEKGCDDPQKGGHWVAVDSDFECDSTGHTGTIITKSVPNNTATSWGQLRFDVPGHPFPGFYRVTATVSHMMDPRGAPGGCAGLAVHTSPDGATADTLQLCADGAQVKGFIISVKDGVEVPKSRQELGNLPSTAESAYDVTAEVTNDQVTWMISDRTDLIKGAGKAVASTTSFIGLDVFFENIGAQAEFSGFAFSRTA
jgi:hypothetical protein